MREEEKDKELNRIAEQIKEESHNFRTLEGITEAQRSIVKTK